MGYPAKPWQHNQIAEVYSDKWFQYDSVAGVWRRAVEKVHDSDLNSLEIGIQEERDSEVLVLEQKIALAAGGLDSDLSKVSGRVTSLEEYTTLQFALIDSDLNRIENASNIKTSPVGSITAITLQDALSQLDSDKVSKSGSTMKGYLNLHADPQTDLQAATKRYVDNKVVSTTIPSENIQFISTGNIIATNARDALRELDSEKISKAGDVMTGYLTLALNPVQGDHAAKLSTVTNAITNNIASSPIADSEDALANRAVRLQSDGTIYIELLPKQLPRTINSIQPDSEGNIALSLTKTIAGTQDERPDSDEIATVFIIAGDSDSEMNGRTYIYTINKGWQRIESFDMATFDSRYLNLTGGTLTGPLYLNANPVLGVEAATKQYVDSSVAGVSPNANIVNFNPANSSFLTYNVQSVLEEVDTNFVKKSGAQMDGYLKLVNSTPTDSEHAASKYFVENYVNTLASNFRLGDNVDVTTDGAVSNDSLVFNGTNWAPGVPTNQATNVTFDKTDTRFTKNNVQDIIEELNGLLEELEVFTVTELNDADSDLNQRVAALQDKDSEIELRIDALISSLDSETNQRTEADSDFSRSLNNLLNLINANKVRADSDALQLNNDVDSLSARIDSDYSLSYTKFNSLEERVSVLETSADSDIIEIKALRRDADSDSIVIQELSVQAAANAATIQTTLAMLDSDGTVLQDLQTQIDLEATTRISDVASLNARIDSDYALASAKVLDLQSQINTFTTNLDSDIIEIKALRRDADSDSNALQVLSLIAAENASKIQTTLAMLDSDGTVLQDLQTQIDSIDLTIFATKTEVDSEHLLIQNLTALVESNKVDTDSDLNKLSVETIDLINQEISVRSSTDSDLSDRISALENFVSPLDSDWVNNAIDEKIETLVDSDFVLTQIEQRVEKLVDSEFVLSVVADSDTIVGLIKTEEQLRKDTDSDLSDRISALESFVSPLDSEWVVQQLNARDSDLRRDFDSDISAIQGDGTYVYDSDAVVSTVQKTFDNTQMLFFGNSGNLNNPFRTELKTIDGTQGQGYVIPVDGALYAMSISLDATYQSSNYNVDVAIKKVGTSITQDFLSFTVTQGGFTSAFKKLSIPVAFAAGSQFYLTITTSGSVSSVNAVLMIKVQ